MNLRLLLPIAYSCLLLALSSIPGVAVPEQEEETRVFMWLAPEVQNLLHLPAYAGLALCWWWALGGFSMRQRTRLVASWLLAASWGIFEEWYQSGVPGRYGSFADAVTDMIGASLALSLTAMIFRRRHPEAQHGA